MTFSEDDLRAATRAGLITNMQFDTLLTFLGSRPAAAIFETPAVRAPVFDVVHMLWYAGALIVIGAMGLFSTLAFSQIGGSALLMIALVYAMLFWWAGDHLWSRRNLRTPGGLLIAVAVAMAPLAVYGFQDMTGWNSKFGKPGEYRDFYVWIKGGWLFMEIAAIVAAAFALRFYRFPFIVLIAAFALWFMSMDIAPWLANKTETSFEFDRQVSIWFGLGMIIIAAIINARQRSGDFAFWLYMFGVIAFWGAITASPVGPPLQKAIYFAMNVAFLGLAMFLGRGIFAVFGTIGISLYLHDLASVFKDSLLFPFALSLIGIAIIALGLYYYRHRDAIAAWFEQNLPPVLKRLRPANAA